MQVYLTKQVMLTDTKRENLHKLKCPSFKFSEGAFEATNAEVHFGIELFSPLKKSRSGYDYNNVEVNDGTKSITLMRTPGTDRLNSWIITLL